MLLIWARAIIQVYMAVNKWNHWHKACHTICGAVPISTIANRATSGWLLHHQKQQQAQAFEKDGERRASWSYVLVHLVCDEHLLHGPRCLLTCPPLHLPVTGFGSTGITHRLPCLLLCGAIYCAPLLPTCVFSAQKIHSVQIFTLEPTSASAVTSLIVLIFTRPLPPLKGLPILIKLLPHNHHTSG